MTSPSSIRVVGEVQKINQRYWLINEDADGKIKKTDIDNLMSNYIGRTIILDVQEVPQFEIKMEPAEDIGMKVIISRKED